MSRTQEVNKRENAHVSQSSRPPRSSFRRKPRSNAQAIQVPSQPLNSSSTTSLEIHCSPVPLATRSLSSRSLTTNGSKPRLSQSSVSSIHSNRKVKSLFKSPRKGEKLAQQVTDNLMSNIDNSHSSDHSDPHNMQSLLQDISSAMQSMVPMLETSRPLQQPSMHSNTSAKNNRLEENPEHLESSQQALKKARKPPRLAAKFNKHGNEEEKCEIKALSLPSAAATTSQAFPPSQDHVPHNMDCEDKHHILKSDPPIIPHLNLCSSSTDGQQINDAAALEVQKNSSSHVQPPLGLDESKSSQKEIAKVNQASSQIEQVKVLLQEKKIDLDQSRQKEMERVRGDIEAHERRTVEREQRRAAKLMADRKAAIVELQRRREEKRARAELLAQKEMVKLEASGKVSRPKMCAKEIVKVLTPTTLRPASSDRRVVKAPDKVMDDFLESGGVELAPPLVPVSLPTTQHMSSVTSIYDEIMDTLRLLEEAPSSLNCHGNTDLSTDNVRVNVSKWSSEEVKSNGSGGLSEGKLLSIFSYLDQVEKAEVDRSKQMAGCQSILCSKQVVTGDMKPQANELSSLEAASATASDVTATIMAQRLELDGKNKTVEMLQKALSQQRELTVYHAKEMAKDGQKRLELQRTEYESTIQRHQCFIDQLIDDKKVLSQQCEKLVKELKELDKKCTAKLTSLEEKHVSELNKIKQVTAATDKLRKEKWRMDETQRIKEATVKGLEPEIQRIIAKGKAEIQKAKTLHEAELVQADERASRRFVVQMEEVREQYSVEREQACAHEREIARQRYEKMAEQEELNYQQQRRRLFTEVAQEKEKIADQMHRQKSALDRQLQENNGLHDRLAEELKVSHSQQLEEISRCHKSELRNVEEHANMERRRWEETQGRKREEEMGFKEREMRRRLREERDKEIEMVISRLEEEMASSKEETEKTAEARVRRIREKCDAELREVERSEKSTLAKFNSMKSQGVELEGEATRLRSLLRQRDQEAERISQVASKLTQERDSVSDIVRQEFADRLVSTEEENKQLKMEMSELRARQKFELERVRRGKDQELVEVHERVKQALEKKEGNLEMLKEQYEGALKRADHLQMLLQRQRSELLKK